MNQITDNDIEKFCKLYRSGGLKAILQHWEEFRQKESVIKEQPERKPVLITEDGVEIFEHQNCWFITPDYKIGAWVNVKIGGIEDTIVKCYFSTQRAAHDYVSENYPRFSLKQMRSIVSDCNDCTDPAFNFDEYIKYIENGSTKKYK